MGFRNSLRVQNGNPETLTMIVEPWANEYDLVAGGDCEIVALNPSVVPTFGVEPHGGNLIVWVNEGGSTFELWRAGVLRESMPVPIPPWPTPKL